MHEIQITVRFGETDALGHVNNTSYFIYMEEARTRFFEAIGYAMDINRGNFIVASATCDFINQGYFNQVLKIKSYVSKIGTKSFQLDHEMYCMKTSKLIAKGNAAIVFFNFDKQQSEPFPDSLKTKLERFFTPQICTNA